MEKKKKEKEFDCIMLYCDITKKAWKNKWLSKIDKEDLYEGEEDDDKGKYGLEDEPHITLLWGIHSEEVDRKMAEAMVQALSKTEVDTENISIFENEEYDVVKIDIIPSDMLLQYRKIFEETLPNTQTFPDFHPHMTLAYVKKGEGKKYIEKFKDPIVFTFNKAVYSDAERKHKTFKLKELNESMAGFMGDITNAIELNNKEASKVKPIKDLRNYMKGEFKKLKTFNQFKNI
jgi:2'-5' RNA ligase